MKKRNFLSFLSLGVLIVGTGATIALTPVHVNEANAADMSTTTWYIVGTVPGDGGWTPTATPARKFEDNADGTLSLKMKFKDGNEFKVIPKENNVFSWDHALGYDPYIFQEYAHNNNGNVLWAGGEYEATLTIKDGKWVDVDVNYGADGHIVTIHDGETIVATRSIKDNSTFINNRYIGKTGYKYDGLYFEPDYSSKASEGLTIKNDLDLYIKYIPHSELHEKVIVTNDMDITLLYGFTTRLLRGPQNDWNDCLKFKGNNGFKTVTIPLEYDIDSVIFRTNNKQSENFNLANQTSTLDDEIYYITTNNKDNEQFTLGIYEPNHKALNDFMTEFRKVRETNGYVENNKELPGICDLTADSPLMVAYNNLNDHLKAILNDVDDFATHSVGETMSYLVSRLTAPTEAQDLIALENMNSVITLSLVLTLTALAFVAFRVISRRKTTK